MGNAMNIQRNWVTPITAGAFLLVGVTGVLIFFPADSGANKFVHEWLSLVLLGESSLTTLAQVAQVTPVQLRERLAKAGVQASSDQQTLAELVGPDTHKQMNVLGSVFKPVE